MSNKVVIGLGMGDEGKGVTTEYLCSQDPKNTIVVRFSGGQQCGHKVIKDNVEHIFSSFGSGTLSECPTYWSSYCTFDPVCFWNEYKLLKEKGVSPKIYIHPDCPVTTIYDVFANRNSIEVEHGTTGTGFFKTKKRHFIDDLRFSVKELFPSFLKVSFKLEDIRKYFGLLTEELDVNIFYEARKNIRELLKAEIVVITDHIPDYKHKIFEGSQGLMLDEHIGHMPHCTPSDVTPRNILNMGYDIDEVFLVSRAYQTRHGNGPMTNEEHPVKLVNIEKETNVHNKYQGDFRTSVLDLDQLIHAKTKGIDEVIPKGTTVNLVITCIDQLNKLKVTHGKEFFIFHEVENFVNFIASSLDINGRIYINNSPYSESIKQLELT